MRYASVNSVANAIGAHTHSVGWQAHVALIGVTRELLSICRLLIEKSERLLPNFIL